MNYPQTLDYLYAQLPMFQRIGAAAFKKDLGNTIKLMDALANPETAFPCIHIAGTNGKGSLAHMLSAIFQSHGYKTGLYTSPHYFDFRERIKIDGKPIDEQFVIDFTAKIKKQISDIQPSFFELTVAMAFDAFRQKKVDIAIIETGLGGRLDSTNVVDPLLSIITNIGYDHMEFLGDTLALIAGEKAGIIKENTPCLVGEILAETKPVFERVCKEKNAALYLSNHILEIKNFDAKLQESSFEVLYQDGETQNAQSNELPGSYQQYNIRNALAAVEIINEKYPEWKLNRSKSIEAICQTRSLSGLIGRFQKIQDTPLFICDSAHNAHGLKEVMQQVNTESVNYDKVHVVFGVVQGKDLSAVLPLLNKNFQYYWCAAQIPRALPAKELQEKAKHFDLKGESHPSVSDAVNAAMKNAGEKDLVFAGGSIFTVAEIPQLSNL
ncbi:MAG: folylpolyglutamate synthase/dihydrofolate synthase family protein [Chitinophagales bacterium]